MRRTVEQNFEEVSTHVALVRDQYDRDAFLAAVETGFLTMGA